MPHQELLRLVLPNIPESIPRLVGSVLSGGEKNGGLVLGVRVILAVRGQGGQHAFIAHCETFAVALWHGVASRIVEIGVDDVTA